MDLSSRAQMVQFTTIVSKGRRSQRDFSWIHEDYHFTLKFNSVGGEKTAHARKPGKAPLVSQIKMSLASTRSCWQILKGRPCTQFQLSFENLPELEFRMVLLTLPPLLLLELAAPLPLPPPPPAPPPRAFLKVHISEDMAPRRPPPPPPPPPRCFFDLKRRDDVKCTQF